MPSVIRPMTNPGRTSSSVHPGPVQRVGQPAGEPVQARFRRAVHVVGAPHPAAGHRGEHHDAAPACRPACAVASTVSRLTCATKSVCTTATACAGVGLGARLVAEDPEGQHGGADRAVLGDDRVDAARACDARSSASNPVTCTAAAPAARTAATCSVSSSAPRAASTTVAPRRQPRGQFDADLAASAENHDHAAGSPCRSWLRLSPALALGTDGERNHPAHQ